MSKWVTGCIAYMRENGIERCEAQAEAAQKWGEQCEPGGKQDSASARHLIPGISAPTCRASPRVFMPYAGGLERYRAICDDVAARGYEGFVLGECQKA